MKRIIFSLCLLLAVLPSRAPLAEAPEPMEGTFSDAAKERAMRAVFQPPAEGTIEGEDTFQMRLDAQGLRDASRFSGMDNDATHYARGSTLVIHVFVNHTGGTWSGEEMSEAGAKMEVAKDHYRSNAPEGANLHFDHEPSGGLYYYSVSLSYSLADSGMTGYRMEDALSHLGVDDNDGDGYLCDDFTLDLMDWNGGWDNVIACFEPADLTGRAWASFGLARCAIYTDDTGNVVAHEWGHIFGACDEYVESGHCNSGVDCGDCQSTYLDEMIQNGNCQLASCPSDVECLMIYNSFANICDYTRNHWGWVDEDANGLLDYVKRRVVDDDFVLINEIANNGYAYSTNTTDGYVASQLWNTWSVVGLRNPAGTDYDLRLYGENNHNYQLAASLLGADYVDFIVSDYNHDRPGNEHVQAELDSGAANSYRLAWESGTGMLYPDGAVRSGSWSGPNVVRVWDVPLFGGESVTFNLDITAGEMDLGMALFKSNGSYYHVPRASAVWSRDAGGVGGSESYTYAVPADDVYGLVVWANNYASGNFTIQIGPSPVELTDGVPYNSGMSLKLFYYSPNAFSWSFAGTRPGGATNVTDRLFNDSTYQTELAASSNYGAGAIEFVAADYNPGYSTDYLRVIRDSGAETHMTMWEHGDDVSTGTLSGTWVSPEVGQAWDVYLRSGQSYFFREYHGGAIDTGIYLFSSADGVRYKPRIGYVACSNSRPPEDGGEWFNYTAEADDWYGLVQIVNDESDGVYSIWHGPKFVVGEDDVTTDGAEVVWGQCITSANYWAVFGARPPSGGAASVWLYGDYAYTISTLHASDQAGTGVNFVVADYGHTTPGTVYPRFRRTAGTGSTDCEWEEGADAMTYQDGQAQSFEFAWPEYDVVDAFDLYVNGTGGQDVMIRVEDLSGVMDLGVALFGSNGATYYADPGAAYAMKDEQGVGGTETFTYHFSRADWYGLVVFNQNDRGGSYRIWVVDPAVMSVENASAVTLDLEPAGANPFTNQTLISYSLPVDGPVDLSIYDVAGRRVRGLIRDAGKAGRHEIIWDGRDDHGTSVATGIYLARLQHGGNERKLKLVRAQ
jgi:hypothetical protein